MAIIPMRHILQFWKSIVLVFIPIALIPLPLSGYQEAKCGYVISIMAFYWMMDLLPLAVVSLIPVVAFPLLGVLSSAEVSETYMKGTTMLLIGGLSMAMAFEYCNLHQRIALFVILHVGQSPRRLMAGIMMTTMFLSMWIPNMASLAIMMPIIESIIEELFKPSRPSSPETLPPVIEQGQQILQSTSNGGSSHAEHGKIIFSSDEENGTSKLFDAESKRAVKNMIYLSVAYSANIGGTGSLTGTPPNLVILGVLKTSFPEQNDLTFTSWMAYNVPGAIICTFMAWIWLQIFYMGCGTKSNFAHPTSEGMNAVKKTIKRKYDALGAMTFHEMMVLILFILLMILWLFREPGFIHGWNYALENFFGKGVYKNIDDGAAALMIVLLLFALPKQLNFWPFRELSDPECNKPSESLLNWQIVHEKLPWSLLLLIGSGFAMAAASKESGLSAWMGEQFRVLDFMPVPAIVLVLNLVVAMVTEVASNTATASILMPVLRDLSMSLCINPLYLMLPAAICCSYAFMLPVATPPNAIVFAASGMKTTEMMKVGLGMNVLCVIMCTVLINTFGVAFFDLNTIPEWMNATESSLVAQCYNTT